MSKSVLKKKVRFDEGQEGTQLDQENDGYEADA